MWSPICDWDFNGGRKMKPRICEILGVNVNEDFLFNGETYWVGRVPFLMHGFIPNATAAEGKIVCDIINHPEKIIRKPRVTDEEKEILRAAVLLHNAKEIHRYDGNIYVTIGWVNHCRELFKVEGANKLFRYIENGEIVEISDLLGE